MNFLQKVYYKLGIDVLYNSGMSFLLRCIWKPFRIMDVEEMLDYIVSKRCSVARFGDGELHIAEYGCPLKFQRGDKRLQNRHLIVIQNYMKRV